ncbi:AMP-dependent synthetase and ligase [Halogeometricum pallidum JCM 14848]|uniref:AMP-dependent synthetase and ligase n=1 Tax=Halogeometricum pallidum JCM 14848 TaxID=1227487 RepID=M0CZJ0_HALPD|nr:AMP-binding protein [Halogeometricum pallidum]ELZ28018.1 AMP-dependent synthetase and ligase [Halogeometricum pallidum JCM 14848]
MRFLDAFRRTVRCHGGETALVDDDGRTFTYAELDDRSTRLANALRTRLGGGRCAVLGGNSPAAIEAMVTGHKRGAATAQLPFRGEAEEFVRMCESVDATGFVFDDANRETAEEVLARRDFEAAVHVGDADVDAAGVESYETVLSDADPTLDEALPAGGECAIFFTSGTTSQPKAVPFDSEQLWYGAIQGVMEHGIDRTDAGIVATPWYHMVSSDAWIYPHFVAGATVVLHSEFDPAGLLEQIEEREATGLLAVPTQLNAVVDAQQSLERDTSSLEYVRTGGSVVSERLVERMSEHVTDRVYNTYGMTEAGPNLTFALPEDQRERPGTIGKEAHTYEIRVVEPAPITEHPDPGATVDAGEEGEIIARSPGCSDGYIDNPEAEAKSYFESGTPEDGASSGTWLRTRDVARIDEEGYLYIVDRVDNMFVSGGENVYPVEVEQALEAHSTVSEAYVFGVDDDHWGRVVNAVVVTEGNVTEEELDEFCRERTDLANYKRPRQYTIRTEDLPRTSTGKIKRGAIADQTSE